MVGYPGVVSKRAGGGDSEGRRPGKFRSPRYGGVKNLLVNAKATAIVRKQR